MYAILLLSITKVSKIPDPVPSPVWSNDRWMRNVMLFTAPSTGAGYLPVVRLTCEMSLAETSNSSHLTVEPV